jgi:hypothetical protein
MNGLSTEEKACNYETMLHIQRVRNLLNLVVTNLIKRGELHDQSKLNHPEVEYFTQFTSKLSSTTYGSEEYKRIKDELAPALEHHYANNRHHPEHHKDGINDMTLMDLIEMFVDWKAASERHNDGNIKKSIEVNANRFGLSSQLTRIFENTARELF